MRNTGCLGTLIMWTIGLPILTLIYFIKKIR